MEITCFQVWPPHQRGQRRTCASSSQAQPLLGANVQSQMRLSWDALGLWEATWVWPDTPTLWQCMEILRAAPDLRDSVSEQSVSPLYRRQEHGGVNLLGNADKYAAMTAIQKDCGGSWEAPEFSRGTRGHGRGIGCTQRWTWDFFPFFLFFKMRESWAPVSILKVKRLTIQRRDLLKWAFWCLRDAFCIQMMIRRSNYCSMHYS